LNCLFRHVFREQSGYGTPPQLAVREWRYVRDQRRFDDLDSLVAQMRRDMTAVAYPAYG